MFKVLQAMRKHECSHEQCLQKSGFDCCFGVGEAEIKKRVKGMTAPQHFQDILSRMGKVNFFKKD